MPPVESTPIDDTAAPAAGRSSPRRRWWIGAAAAVVVAALLVWFLMPSAPPPPTRAEVDRSVQDGIEKARQDARNAPADASVAFQAIGPSLVTVTSQRPGGGSTETALGSGVVVSARGAVLTALHVVDGASAVQVRFADGTTSAARIADAQPASDVAVLAVDELPQLVVPAVLGGGPAVGDTVFAVGNPLGLRDSLSAGVVSALGRSITAPGGATLPDLIQFDAAVNPGNSGGPLLNRAGQVVGIVTGLANPADEDFFVGIGFAVPIATAAGGAGGPMK
ncbi:S1C family serine protease [Pseudonocardia sp.]|uniref:S1C family serine protease n=1 Tax=Pseudonocardia sp. TaxID=60912 RepID=UPI003D0F25A3